MEDALIPIIGMICSIALPLLLAMVLGKFRHDERMSMIEKGVSLDAPGRQIKRYPALRNGLFMIGLALGALVGLYISPSLPVYEDWSGMSVPIMSVLFGGIGFVVYFFLSRRMEMKDKEATSEQE